VRRPCLISGSGVHFFFFPPNNWILPDWNFLKFININLSYLRLLCSALMKSVLQLVACIVPFLLWEQTTQLPYKVSLMIPQALPEQHEAIIRVLCINLLPNTLGKHLTHITTQFLSSPVVIHFFIRILASVRCMQVPSSLQVP